MFTREELVYLRQQMLARLATVDAVGQPTVDAVGFQFEGGQFYIGGIDLARSRKYRNIAAGNTQVSLIVDDVASMEPYQPRGIKVHGSAKIVSRQDGFFGEGEYFVITPRTSWSWGVIGPAFQEGRFASHKIRWQVNEPAASPTEEAQPELQGTARE